MTKSQRHLSKTADISTENEVGRTRAALLDGSHRHEHDAGLEKNSTTTYAQRIQELEHENRELRKANEILKLANTFFARTELDRRPK